MLHGSGKRNHASARVNGERCPTPARAVLIMDHAAACEHTLALIEHGEREAALKHRHPLRRGDIEALVRCRRETGQVPSGEGFCSQHTAQCRAEGFDVQQWGPIVLHDGMVLLRSCRSASEGKLDGRMAKVEPATVEWDGPGDLAAYVVSKNLHRRHLNESQRGLIAAKLANMKHGVDRKSENIKGSKEPLVAVKAAADLLNVSPPTVKRGKTVIAKGTPEEIKGVEAGTLSVASVAKQIRSGMTADQRREAREEKRPKPKKKKRRAAGVAYQPTSQHAGRLTNRDRASGQLTSEPRSRRVALAPSHLLH